MLDQRAGGGRHRPAAARSARGDAVRAVVAERLGDPQSGRPRHRPHTARLGLPVWPRRADAINDSSPFAPHRQITRKTTAARGPFPLRASGNAAGRKRSTITC
jgi:hypothetical protein